MTSKGPLPETLLEAARYFADPQVCIDFVASLRWPEGPICPSCEGREHSYLTTRKLWKCKACKRQFSVKVGTIFEDSPLPLDKWLLSIWLISNSKNGISSHELHRSIGITQKSAWFVLHRVRLALQEGTFETRVGGTTEVDETFLGGKAKNMHEIVRAVKVDKTGSYAKTVVVGAVERGGQVRAEVISDVQGPTLTDFVRRNVRPGSEVFTDSHTGYRRLSNEYDHDSVNHSANEYVRGRVHTNTVENFWSLLKRSINGTYVQVAPEHVFRYVNERAYAFNHRHQNDLVRFADVLTQVAGRRLTYAELTGNA